MGCFGQRREIPQNKKPSQKKKNTQNNIPNPRSKKSNQIPHANFHYKIRIPRYPTNPLLGYCFFSAIVKHGWDPKCRRLRAGGPASSPSGAHRRAWCAGKKWLVHIVFFYQEDSGVQHQRIQTYIYIQIDRQIDRQIYTYIYIQIQFICDEKNGRNQAWTLLCLKIRGNQAWKLLSLYSFPQPFATAKPSDRDLALSATMAHIEEYAYELQTLGDSLRWKECVVDYDPKMEHLTCIRDLRRILYRYYPDTTWDLRLFKLARSNCPCWNRVFLSFQPFLLFAMFDCWSLVVAFSKLHQ